MSIPFDTTAPALALAGALTLTAPALAGAGTIHVPADQPTIQAAIDASPVGGTVLVADGIYTGPGNRDIDLGGKDLVVRSENGAASCVIDCQATERDPHRGFLVVNGESRATLIEGFTITRGATEQGAISDPFNGGAMLIVGSSPTVRGMHFVDNWSGCWGGAVFSGHGGSPWIDRCRFEGNYSDDDGGAFFSWDGAAPEITSSVFLDNEARVFGGAIVHFSHTFLSVRGCTMVGNTAPTSPAAWIQNAEIVSSIVWDNGPDPVFTSNLALVSHSIVEGGFPGVGNLDLDPLLRADRIHVLPGSPSIDAGDPLAAPGADELDFDGQPRALDGIVDIGADERRRSPGAWGPPVRRP